MDELGIKRKKIDESLLSSELMKQVSEDDGSYHNKQSTIYTDAQIQQETNKVAEVLRIKQILDKSESVAALVYESLSKLQDMGLSFKTLEATRIRKSVNALKNHASTGIRQIASTLLKVWKGLVDENMSANSKGGDGSAEWNITNPTKKLKDMVCKQQTTKIKQSTNYSYLNMERNKIQIADVKAKGDHVKESKKMDSSIEEKLEATKRKLHQGYEEAENKKRQRRIKVIELHQLAEAHQTQQKNRRQGKWGC